MLLRSFCIYCRRLTEIKQRITEESEGMQSLYTTFREDPENPQVRTLYVIHLENWNLYRKQYESMTTQLRELRQVLSPKIPIVTLDKSILGSPDTNWGK